MMTQRSMDRLFFFLIWFFIAIFSITIPAISEEIRGEVVETSGTRVRIKYHSETVPRTGDSVEIGDEVVGTFYLVEGDWQVTEVSPSFIWVESRSVDSGIPVRGYIAIIHSESATSLTWTTTDLGDDQVWFGANQMCNALEHDGSSEWKLPTMEELKLLYESGDYDRLGIQLKGCCAWSSDVHQEKSTRFLFGKKYTDYTWAFNFDTGEPVDIEWTYTTKKELARHPGIHVLCVMGSPVH